MSNNRRRFLQRSLASAAGFSAFSASAYAVNNPFSISSRPRESKLPRASKNAPQNQIRFSVIGLNHGHIYGQVSALMRGGGELVAVYAKEQDLLQRFTRRYPDAKVASSEQEILEDPSIQLIASASIPVERAPLGIKAMQHGKDYMADKPGITTLEQLAEVRKVQKETGRIYSIMYSERLSNPATVQAGELVKSGAIGKVVQTIGMGPHRMRADSRPEWFFELDKFGGILTDIGSHQCDQFLFFTGSKKAEVLSSQVGNVGNAQYPEFEDFGDMHVVGDEGTGYIRIDWFTPDGLNTWGDGRLTILGTEGFIELRKYTDLGGRDGGNHLFLVDKKETKYIDCTGGDMPYGEQLVNDVVNRTETAMTQDHCFMATELALLGQKNARKLEF